jgi:hypothetical protein
MSDISFSHFISLPDLIEMASASSLSLAKVNQRVKEQVPSVEESRSLNREAVFSNVTPAISASAQFWLRNQWFGSSGESPL